MSGLMMWTDVFGWVEVPEEYEAMARTQAEMPEWLKSDFDTRDGRVTFDFLPEVACP